MEEKGRKKDLIKISPLFENLSQEENERFLI